MGSFGQGFINILTPVVKGLNVILEKLKVVGEWFAKITGYVFGEADTGSSGGGIVDTSIYDNATDGALGLGDAISDAGDAAEKAGKQAKKGLLSFDEVNQLNDSSGSGGSGGSGSAGDSSNTEGLGNALNNVGTMADTLTNKVGTLKKDTDSWLDKLIELLGKVADGIADIVSKLLSIKPDMGLNWDSNKNTTKDNITNEITNYSATFDDAAATECMTKVQALKQKIDATLNKPSYIKVLLVEGDFVARVQAMQIILDSLKDKVVTISCIGDLSVLDAAILKLGSLDAIANTTLNGALKRLWEFIKGSFKADTSLALTLVSNNGQTAFKTLGSFMDSCKKTGDEVSAFFKNVFTGNFSGAFENVKNTGTAWKEHLINCFVNAKENCNANTEALRSWVVSKWENLKTLVTGHSTSMKDKTTSDTSTMKAKFTDLGSYVSGTFATKIGSGCTSISTKFSSMWSSIKTGCTSALNYMIDKINGLTSKLNSKLNFTLPSVLGGGHVGFSIPQIPRLARGGIVDGATNFGNYIAGEAGKEMIVPLENTSFVNTLASALGNAVMYAMSTSLQNSNTGNDGQDIKLEMDGMTFARSITPYIIKEMQRVGVEL